jgi:hypothetical protein
MILLKNLASTDNKTFTTLLLFSHYLHLRSTTYMQAHISSWSGKEFTMEVSGASLA